MEIFTASGQSLIDILSASGNLIQASFGSVLDSVNLIGTSLSTLINGVMLPSLGYVPFLQASAYYVDDTLITPFLDVNAPENPLALDGFLLP